MVATPGTLDASTARQHQTVPSGTRLLRHRASADGFFLIVRSRATVILDERRVDLGPGQFFGEIALLEDVPRTASVVASTDLTLNVIRSATSQVRCESSPRWRAMFGMLRRSG